MYDNLTRTNLEFAHRKAEKRIEELEKENELLGERCNQLLKDKGDLTDQIADIKANCDLAIEGRDVKIMELEQQIEELQEKHKQEILDLVLSNSSERAKLESDFMICEKNADTYYDLLTKAIKLLKQWVELYKPKLEGYPITPIQEQTEQFIKEIEK